MLSFAAPQEDTDEENRRNVPPTGPHFAKPATTQNSGSKERVREVGFWEGPERRKRSLYEEAAAGGGGGEAHAVGRRWGSCWGVTLELSPWKGI